jgi:hypothetical protein
VLVAAAVLGIAMNEKHDGPRLGRHPGATEQVATFRPLEMPFESSDR